MNVEARDKLVPIEGANSPESWSFWATQRQQTWSEAIHVCLCFFTHGYFSISLQNEYMKDNFLIKIETWHKPDTGHLENVIYQNVNDLNRSLYVCVFCLLSVSSNSGWVVLVCPTVITCLLVVSSITLHTIYANSLSHRLLFYMKTNIMVKIYTSKSEKMTRTCALSCMCAACRVSCWHPTVVLWFCFRYTVWMQRPGRRWM